MFGNEEQKKADCENDPELMHKNKVQGSGRDWCESISDKQSLVPGKTWDKSHQGIK